MSMPDAFQVLADPSRRHMLQLLMEENMTIGTLAENFDMSRPAVSKHIRILQDAGFIHIEDIGRERYCSLRREGFDEVQNFINSFDRFWTSRLHKLATLLQAPNKKR